MKKRILIPVILAIGTLSLAACWTVSKPVPTATPNYCQTVWDGAMQESISSFPKDNPLMENVDPYDIAYELVIGSDCSVSDKPQTCKVLQDCVNSGWRPIQDTRIMVPRVTGQTPSYNITSTPIVGFSKSNPAPFGKSIVIGYETIKVTKVIRPANDLVDEFDTQMYPLAAGQEYIAVRIAIECNKSQDETCMGVDFAYSIVGSSGQLVPNTVIQVLNECIDCEKVYGGGTLEGYVVFIIDQKETDLILVAEARMVRLTAIYLSLE
jgi:hypothetical protein